MKDKAAIEAHPLYPVFVAAIEQVMYGKGERHGGNVTPFLEQPWSHYAKLHGRGFLTGQAAKKLEEAASLRSGDAFKAEMLGSIVYAGMSIIHEQGASESASNDADGWIAWEGVGDPEIPMHCVVEYKLRSGGVAKATASSLWWKQDGDPADIIAYRIVK